jgi:hypothetical protein
MVLIPAVVVHLAFVFLGWTATAVVFCLVVVIMAVVAAGHQLLAGGNKGVGMGLFMGFLVAVMWAVIVAIHVWVFGSNIWSIRWQELTGWF